MARPGKITPEIGALVGVRPNKEIAAIAGCTLDSVAAYAKCKGISTKPRLSMEILVLLGTRTDEEVAKLAGVSQPTIWRWRTRRNISPKGYDDRVFAKALRVAQSLDGSGACP